VAFFRVLAHLREGFQHRAEVTSALLRDPATAYVLVASTAPTSLDDARHLGRELASKHAPASLVLFNKAFVAEPGTDVPLEARGLDTSVPPELVSFVQKVSVLRRRLVDEREEGLRVARDFLREVAPRALGIALAEQERDLRTIEDLDRLLDVNVPLRAD
jgi:hypothetical protein